MPVCAKAVSYTHLARYSLKVEFDHYLPQGNYHGLDKLSLDASFQDNSYLKTVLAFDMMRFMGVPTPLCSYAWVRVNGEDLSLIHILLRAGIHIRFISHP